MDTTNETTSLEAIGKHFMDTLRGVACQNTINLGNLTENLFNGFEDEAIKAYFDENIAFTNNSNLDYYESIEDAIAAMLYENYFKNYVADKDDQGEFYVDVIDDKYCAQYRNTNAGLITTFQGLVTVEDWFEDVTNL